MLFRSNERADGFCYTRLGNPTNMTFEKTMASLEGGAAAVGFASGMGAISAAVLAHVKSGDHVVSSQAIYGGTNELFNDYLPNWGIGVTYVDTNDLDAVRAAIRPTTRIVYTETIGNPTLRVPDIAGVADIAHEAEALLLIDSTFATPYLCRPIEHGADVVMHSATKAISGHADTIAGVVVGRTCEVIEPIAQSLHVFGGALAPLNAFLLCRGIKTLALRVERSCETAQKLAEFLEAHPKVDRVHYPGLDSHPDHALAEQQLAGYGGVLAVEIAGGMQPAMAFLDGLDLVALAASLGECHTLATHPASTTHRQYTREEREASGIADGFVRLSAGLEDSQDVIADFEQALAKV